MSLTVTNNEFVQLPEDTPFVAELTSLEKKTIEWKDRATGQDRSADIIEWYFKVVDGDYKGQKVKGSCDLDMSSHPKNKLRNWSEALLGRAIEVGEQLDLEILAGRRAVIEVWHRPDKKDPHKTWTEVVEVMEVPDDEIPF